MSHLEAIIRQITTNSITTVDLSYEKIEDVEAKDLAEALKINHSITTLNLYGQIGDIKVKDLAETLKINQSITTLYLKNTNMEGTEIKELSEALKVNQSITTLNFYFSQIGDDGMKELAEALKVNQAITTLKLEHNQIGDVGTKYLSETLKINHSITILYLRDNPIGDVGAKYLAETLKINHSITNLDLAANKIGAAGTEELAETLKINQAITTLALYNNPIGNVGAKYLAETLKINHSITSLALDGIYMGDAGAKDIAEALQINKSITDLGLGASRIGDAGAKDVAEALKVNNSITSLALNHNDIGDAGTKYLAEALKINQSITSLDLSYNKIRDAGAKDLAEALKINHSITSLRLSSTEIRDAGVKDLAEALQINKSITSLDLYWSYYPGHDKTKALDEALQINRKFAEKARQEAEKLKQQQQTEVVEKARQEALAEQARQQEAERVEQQTNLKEQEEVKTIKEVVVLIRDGNDRLQEHGKKGILLLGNTGAGKSTLAHLFSGRELQAIFDDETDELVIDAMQPLANIVIGHKLASETKIPNKCFAKDIIIWDCPGFNDTDPVQEIANGFYIKRLFETTEQLKFVLVIPELVLNSANERGSIFLTTLSNFIKSFKDIGAIESSISLVVTHVSPHKNIQHIKKSIEKILADNQGATDEHKALINKLKEDGSIHLFYKPTDKGELVVPDLLAAIDGSSKYSDATGDMVNIAISKKAMECSSHLLNTASNNFNQLLEVIVKAIGNATKCLNVNPLNAFSENYNLVKDWIPSSINYHELKQHSEGEYFLELELLARLQQVFSKPIDSISTAIIKLQIAVEIFAEYAESDNSQLKHQIQEYGYCLQQQYDYVQFFSDVCKAALPDHAKIAELITACHTKVTENLEYQVSSLPIDKNQSDSAYYHEALKYLKNYQDSPACKNLKAIAYSCLATIAEKDGGNEAASVYYAKAIEANSHLPDIYEKLGQLFFNKGEYAKAIDCYKIVNDEFRIKACFKAWLKQDKENPNIMLQQAEYFESIGLFEKAKTYYHDAFSLSHDENFKATALEKIGNIMANTAPQSQNFITRAREHDFYNYKLVNEAFTHNLLGDIVSN
ncbi:hypothetical protein [Candidatus Tisiphia endosymbiont of Ptychoptera albimana]|uniref:hypothetical protein n=1 Tax=Candidatus Tisiphia endosymbiont of Ptychoptera albimana TaxID=3066260 RepID=UPI00312CADBD